MNVLLVSTDLLASSQFEGAARGAGVTLTVAGPGKAAAIAEQKLARLVVIDLSAPIEDLPSLVATLKALDQPPSVVAYGPHVQEQKLEQASQSGCDAVLTRGQFHRQAAEVIARYADSTSSDASGAGSPDSD